MQFQTAPMPDDNRLDPFSPAKPRIPGVPTPVAESAGHPAELPAPPSVPRKEPGWMPASWIRLTVAGGLVVGIGLVWSIHRPSPKRAARGSVVAILSPSAVEDKPRPAEDATLAPGPVATTDELAKAWSAKRFLIRNPLTTEPIPAIVVHLPGGSYWGFSLREPYGDCQLEYVTDLKKLRDDYHFHAVHPMVGDPCTGTLFDLTRYGNAPGGLVRGEVEQGSAIRPPVAIEIRTQGKQIVAVRTE
jgi:hypothetical protein